MKAALPPKNQRLRWAAFVCLLVICLGGFGYIFYKNDWEQTQERARPEGYPGVPARYASHDAGLPILYHFYSPDCPCSSFVEPEVARLAAQYRGKIRVLAISAEKDEVSHTYPTMLDTAETIARHLGVFCTPQAVITSADGQILYAGGYNRARLCSDDSTAYVEAALREIMAGQFVKKPRGPIFGCLLPSQED